MHYLRIIILISTLVSWLLCSASWCQVPSNNREPAAELQRLQGQIIQKFKIDLNGDGCRELVVNVAYNHSQNGFLGQLAVIGSDNQVLWQGPRAPYAAGQSMQRLDPRTITENTLFFGEIEGLNVDIIAVFTSFANNCPTVLAAEHPRSLLPMSFRVMVWDGAKFVPVFNNSRLRENPAAPDSYEWTKEPMHTISTGWKAGRWITDLVPKKDGSCFVAKICDVKVLFSDNSIPVRREGIAEVTPDTYGFCINKWVEPLK